jgi:methylene-fatty-acyl-phospholipid synthase
MSALVVLVAAAALVLERACYLWVWRHPQRFEALAAQPPLRHLGGGPVAVLRSLFYAFKALQSLVFAGWCLWWGGGAPWPPAAGPVAIAAGVVLTASGQFLNASVFHRLGTVGVFYGNRFGHRVSWCTGFPFSVLRHPQYVGTLLSIWGLFLILRFPHGDWWLLPAIETVYYAAGAHLEQ